MPAAVTLTTDQVAESLGIGPSSVLPWVRDGLLIPEAPYDAADRRKAVQEDYEMQKRMRFSPEAVAFLRAVHFGAPSDLIAILKRSR